jgi:Trm5-related predicted tRNA methylase
MSDGFLYGAIDRTSEEFKENIVKTLDSNADGIFDLSEQQGADALVINGIYDTMRALSCGIKEIQYHLEVPVKYLPIFQQIEKGLYGTPTSDDLKEMIGEA